MPQTSNIGRFGYTGQAWLPELGLWYYKARMYAPGLGRFLQTDPIGYAGGMNLYAYAGLDPINRGDPNGLAPQGLKDDGIEPDKENPPDIIVNAPRHCFGCDHPRSEPVLLTLYNFRREASLAGLASTAGASGIGIPQTEKLTEICDTPLRTGGNIRQNVATVKAMLQSEIDSAGWSNNEQAAAGSGTIGFWFSRVAPGGKWAGRIGEPWGNWNYGATGRAAGIPLDILLRGAGAAERLEALTGRTGSGDTGEGSPFGSAPYGDNRAGQEQIRQGYNAGC